MTKLSISEIESKLQTVASYSIEALQLVSAKELSELCRDIVPGNSRMTKAQKLEILIEKTNPIREKQKLDDFAAVDEKLQQAVDAMAFAKQNQQPTYTEETTLLTRAINTAEQVAVGEYEQLKASVNQLCRSNQFDKNSVLFLKQAFSLCQREQAGYSESTVKGRRTKLIRQMRALLEQDTDKLYPDHLKDALGAFEKALMDNYREMIIGINQAYKVQVKESNSDQQLVNLTEELEKAIATLSAPDDFKWTEIVLALCLVTGRRPSEICCSAIFEKLDSHWLSFKGQGKRRSGSFDANNVINIPCLCDTDLVKAGIEELEDQGRRYPYDPSTAETHRITMSKAGNKISKELSRDKTKWTSKDYRAIYELASYEVFSKLPSTQNWLPKMINCSLTAWGSTVLGHIDSDQLSSVSYSRMYFDEQDLASAKRIILL